MNKYKVSFVLNILVFILVSLGLCLMIFDIRFMDSSIILSNSKIEALKYYTVDSNILAGISCFIFAVCDYLFVKKKIRDIPKIVYLLKYISTVCVTITFIVTALFLSPSLSLNFYELYTNSNLFFHLIVPVLSFISFCFYEKSDVLSFKHILLSFIPTVIYGTIYAINCFSHMSLGRVSLKHDFYGFLKGGVGTSAFVIVLFLSMNFLVSYFIKKINSD